MSLRKNRVLRCTLILAVALLLTGFGRVPVLREFAAFLVIEDELQPAAAIVALAGHTPFREMEAARIYREGWAPRVIIVRSDPSEEARELAQMGIQTDESWEVSRDVLLKQGVPESAILTPKLEGGGTLEELESVGRALGDKNGSLILVTSKYHTRRTRLTWNYVTHGRSRSIVRAASRDPFDPSHWWRDRRFVLAVVREYLGLINYYAGFPVGTGSSG
jgi:uncharacterized SAM-binding protein YcdF (DUF218 family)